MYRYPDNFIKLFEKSFRRHAHLPALSLYGKPGVKSYLHLAKNIAFTHLLLKEIGIEPGDKIALCGKDSDMWVEAFMAVITYGATVVPILPDFSPDDIVHILRHSEARLLMVSDSIFHTLPIGKLKDNEAIFSLDTSKLLAGKDMEKVQAALDTLPARFADAYPNGFKPSDIAYPDVSNDNVIVLNYTSGTTGFSKGVMLTGWNLAGNVVFGMHEHLHWARSRVLTFLPLAHAYGCTFDMLTPLACGTHITVLGRTPTPAILLKALQEVKPHLILSVPLVFEKIYRKRIEPLISTPRMQRLLQMPVVKNLVHRKLRSKLMKALGGEFSQVIIGGAAMDAETEAFLRMIHFPFTVGYGMTECGPLVSYTFWKEFIPGSAGRTLPEIMETRVESPDPQSIPGEIFVRGQNVMAGYYKAPDLTAQVLDEHGWLNTGDMGTRSIDGTIFLRGRSKTMILSASGQNIYPEELEAKLNAMPFVGESIVLDRDGRLTALVFPDHEALKSRGIEAEKIPALMEKIRVKLNGRLAPYERLAAIETVEKEFEKTPNRSIKRFLSK